MPIPLDRPQRALVDRLLKVGFKIQAAARLGLPNVARFVWYKLQLKNGWGPAALQPSAIENGDMFRHVEIDSSLEPSASLFPIRYFGWLASDATAEKAPDWFLNPVAVRRFTPVDVPWYRLPDFDPNFGDIKWVWELSRLDWMIRLAQYARAGKRAGSREILNGWLRDWLEKNPPYLGPNWKCGQETSIRVLHLAFAANILRQVDNPSKPLMDTILAHLRRIASSTHYAIAQDNNHGTSEAAALFVGGAWMARCCPGRGYEALAEKGRHLLEERVQRLIMTDGSFSQYSVNYHRLMLDTLSLAELWRRNMAQSAFSDLFYARARAATNWLHSIVDSKSGEVPNIGANDGARLLPLTDGYRDFRPSVQTACALFLERRAYDATSCDEQLRWLDLVTPSLHMTPSQSVTYADGGFAVMRRGDVGVVARFPRFRFRPSHADALHLDIWFRGDNILRDSGTYSYLVDDQTMALFTGVAGHNTVQFDGRDQMPRLSRFLYGGWLSTKHLEPVAEQEDGRLRWSAAYRDWLGAEHQRAVLLSDRDCRISDRVAGFKSNAVLRWHLGHGAWTWEGDVLCGERGVRITVKSGAAAVRREIIPRQISLYYGKLESVSVLEVEVRSPCELETVIAWPPMP